MFETAMFFDAMEKLQTRAHQNSVKHGFWDGPDNDNIPTKLCLIHSEVSEWLEAFRKDPKAPCEKIMPEQRVNEKFIIPAQVVGIIDSGGVRPITKEEEEAADVFIRLLDLCEKRGIDLARVTLAKMAYNETRDFRHGGKRV